MKDNPIVFDLPDFTPETYEIRFSINGNRYLFRYGEAKVDEVLKLMAAVDDTTDFIARSRATVEGFLTSNCVDGDRDKLKEDLKLVPYRSQRQSLDIIGIMNALNQRFKKKEGVGAGE